MQSITLLRNGNYGKEVILVSYFRSDLLFMGNTAGCNKTPSNPPGPGGDRKKRKEGGKREKPVGEYRSDTIVDVCVSTAWVV